MPLLDAITRGFIAALGTGFQVLASYSLPLLAVLAVIHFYMTMGQSVASGGHAGDALAEACLLIIRIGIFYWVCTNLWPMAQAGLHTFTQWGAAAGGGGFNYADFLSPSRVWEMGWVIAQPIDAFIARHSGMRLLWNAPDLLFYWVAKFTIVVAFWFAALAVLLTVIEFFLAVVCGAVLIPWGILSATASLCEFALSWIVGGCIRSLLTALIMAIGVTMQQQMPLTMVEGDPTIFGSATLAGGACVLAVLIWNVPKRAAMVAGRGAALGLGADTLTSAANTGWRTAVYGVSQVGGVIRGVSQMLPRRGGGA